MSHFLLLSLFFFPQQPSQAELISETEIMTLSPEMIEWVDRIAPPESGPEQKLVSLVRGIFSPEQLNLTYDNYRTKTVRETFAERKGNCLSLTLMFAAMAQHAGLNASFQEVNIAPTWDRRQGVLILNRHINTVVRIYNREHIVDFNPEVEHHAARVSRVKLSRALSQFYNNRGAEQFSNRNYELAKLHFEKALALTPDLTYAWTNLGVLRASQADLEGAEQAYLMALKRSGSEPAALNNLVRLYQRWGKAELALKYEKKALKFRDANPYYHYELGNDALENGHFEAAVIHFKNAIRRKPKTHEFYFSIAKAYASLGDKEQVAQYLEKAREFSPDVFNRDRYSQKLEMLAKK